MKDSKRSGALLAKHIFKKSLNADYEDRLMAWNSSKPLRDKEEEPMPPRPRSSTRRTSAEVFPDAQVVAAVPPQQSRRDRHDSIMSAKTQMHLTEFPDRCNSELIARFHTLLMKFFVANNIAFNVVESTEMKELLQCLRPALVSAGGIPSRRRMSGALLDNLYNDVKAKVDSFINIFLRTGDKTTMVLDGWENVNREHLVNFLVVIGGMTLFLDSKMIGSTNQTADNQAKMVQTVLEPYGGVESFAAVASDNTASCMNDIICNANPGIVSLNDQAHVANLLFSDVCKIKFIVSAIDSCSTMSSYIRNHQYVNALYKTCKTEFNETLKQRKDENTDTAVNFSSIPATRFCYRLDAVEECLRNRKACLDLIFAQDKLQQAANPNTSAKKEAYDGFIKTVEARSTWRSMVVAVKVLTPLRVYLRLFDKDVVDITSILRDTKQCGLICKKNLTSC